MPRPATLLWVTLAFATNAAAAQMLDLSGPRRPEAGEGTFALSIAQRLLDDAGDPDAQRPRDRASGAYRRLAARIIRTGEAQGVDGATLVLDGMTMGALTTAFDAAVENMPDPQAAFLAHDLGGLSENVPPDAAHLRTALRDTLALALTDTAVDHPAGWFATDGGPTDQNTRSLDEARAMLPPQSRAVQRIDRLIAASTVADRWPTHAAAIGRLATLVRTYPIDADLPPAFEAAQRERFIRALNAESSPAAERRLRIGHAAHTLATMTNDFPRDATGRRERDRLLGALSDAEAMPDLDRMLRAIDLLAKASELNDLPNERTLAIPLRPAYRALTPGAQTAAVRGRSAAIDIVFRPGADTDPAVLTHARETHASATFFRSYIELSGLIDDGSGQPLVEYRALGDRVLAIGRDALDGDVETSKNLLQSLLEDRALALRLARLLPEALVAVNEGLVRSSLAPEIVRRANSARALWTNAWSSPGSLGVRPDDRRAAIELEALLELLADLAAARGHNPAEPVGPLDAWPAWHVPEAADVALRDGLKKELDRVLNRSFAPDAAPGRIEAEIRPVEGRYAVVLLEGRLARCLPEGVSFLSGAYPPLDASGLAEIATGPVPGSAWMHDDIDDIARIARYASEFHRRDRPDGLEAYLASMALPLRASLDPDAVKARPR